MTADELLALAREVREVKLTAAQVAWLAQGSYSLPKEWTP